MHPLPDAVRAKLAANGDGLTILVLRMGALGDVLRTLPPVRLVRIALPEARIYWVVDDRWEIVVADHPDLDGFFTIPRRDWSALGRSPATWPRLLRTVFRFVREIRSVGADLVLDFHGNLRSGVVGRLSGAPVRLGHGGHQQKEGNRLFTTHRVPAGARRRSRMERGLGLVRALGIADGPLPDGGLPFSVECVRTARDVVAERVGRGRPYALLSAGASKGQSYKKPPAALLGAAARALAAREIAPLVVFGPGEEADAIRAVEASGGTATMSAPTDLRVLATMARHARLMVAGDTGPLHLACAVGCPVIGIYGPTDPAVNAPWGVPHAAIQPPSRVYTGIKRIDRAGGGFEGLTPDAVAAAVNDVLDRAEARRTARRLRDA